MTDSQHAAVGIGGGDDGPALGSRCARDGLADWLRVDPSALAAIPDDGILALVGVVDVVRELVPEVVAAHRDTATRLETSVEFWTEAAKTDVLTGLRNRHGLDELLEREIKRASRHGRTLAVLIIDVDGLKKINDELGHAAGDQLLRGTGDLLRAAVRSDDIVCRLGGDEFLIICPETDISGVTQLVGRIERATRTFAPIDLAIGKLGLSVGYACSDGVMDATELLRSADKQLYRAKAAEAHRGAR